METRHSITNYPTFPLCREVDFGQTALFCCMCSVTGLSTFKTDAVCCHIACDIWHLPGLNEQRFSLICSEILNKLLSIFSCNMWRRMLRLRICWRTDSNIFSFGFFYNGASVRGTFMEEEGCSVDHIPPSPKPPLPHYLPKYKYGYKQWNKGRCSMAQLSMMSSL